MNKEFVENLTMAYIYSYSIAVKEVKNQNLATQIAASVITAIAITTRGDRQTFNPLELLFAHIQKQAGQQDGKNREKEEEQVDKK